MKKKRAVEHPWGGDERAMVIALREERGWELVDSVDHPLYGLGKKHYELIFEKDVEMCKRTVTISLAEYESLKRASAELDFLEARGVDNWPGYAIPRNAKTTTRMKNTKQLVKKRCMTGRYG